MIWKNIETEIVLYQPEMLIGEYKSSRKDVEVMYVSYVNRVIKITQIYSAMIVKCQSEKW